VQKRVGRKGLISNVRLLCCLLSFEEEGKEKRVFAISAYKRLRRGRKKRATKGERIRCIYLKDFGIIRKEEKRRLPGKGRAKIACIDVYSPQDFEKDRR